MILLFPDFVMFTLSFSIVRIIFRRYAVYIGIATGLLIVQLLSGYYLFQIDNEISGMQWTLYQSQLKKNSLHKVNTNNIFNFKNSDNLYNVRDRQNSTNGSFMKDNLLLSEEVVKSLTGIKFPCNINSKDALSAFQRASSLECKSLIANISCQIQNGNFYPSRLPNYCPTQGRANGKYVGCFIDSTDNRILRGSAGNLKKNTPTACSDICYQRGYFYSGVQYSKECFCGNEEVSVDLKRSENECSMQCSGNTSKVCGGHLRMNVYETGLSRNINSEVQLPFVPNNFPKIVYILTLNGRGSRQVFRLFRSLFHKDNFFYIHVDCRQDFLFREVLQLEKYKNVRVSRYRLSTIWGGASLLKILLHCMSEILKIKEWDWDFLINLSESDFPVKNNSEIINFLAHNAERNFLKSHGHDTNKFLQKQGLDRTFLECEKHMWRLGERQLPLGICFDGGSDWFCLHRNFIEYLISTDDELVSGLRQIYLYTLLPAESFFHTVLHNSKFCSSFTDNNLHLTNWKRKLGCKCQYKHIVDWCGCSPNVFKPMDWSRIENSKMRNIFFGRKFDPSINQEIINYLSTWLYGECEKGIPGIESYWENRYHHQDIPIATNDLQITVYNALSRMSIKNMLDQFSDLHSSCMPVAEAVLTVHDYYKKDVFQGILVEYSSVITFLGTFRLETYVSSNPKLKITVTGLHYIKNIEVNSNFDVKEQLFRNPGLVLGPKSTITIALWLHEQKEKLDFTIVIIDPRGTVASIANLIAQENEQVVHHTFCISTPLLPGFWVAKVFLEKLELASFEFFVTPFQFYEGRVISLKEAGSLHSGSSVPYSITNSTYSGLNFSCPLPVNLTGAFGIPLLNIIDDYFKSYYEVKETCYIDSYYVPNCIQNILKACSSTEWSSYSPDPKSSFGDIDVVTGNLKMVL